MWSLRTNLHEPIETLPLVLYAGPSSFFSIDTLEDIVSSLEAVSLVFSSFLSLSSIIILPHQKNI